MGKNIAPQYGDLSIWGLHYRYKYHLLTLSAQDVQATAESVDDEVQQDQQDLEEVGGRLRNISDDLSIISRSVAIIA